MSRPIVILGATSQIASDFMVRAHRQYGVAFALFARRPDAISAYLEANDLPESWRTGSLSEFRAASAQIEDAAAIINFVGVGDPAKARAMGAAIFEATLQSDELASAFIAERPDTPYIFCSSGAVYGTDFEAPADASTRSIVPINALQPQHFYTISKLHAEAMHRASFGNTIIDLRIFNYFSRTQDPNARFLITDMVRCVAENAVFQTTDTAMTRDYIAPGDLCALILALVDAPRGTNGPIDAYSRAPITKAELIDLFRGEFGLSVSIQPHEISVKSTGVKPEYFSLNRAAKALGYEPVHTSAESITIEARAMLDRIRAGQS